MYKKCKKCFLEQPIDCFRVQKARYGPFILNQCKKCEAEYTREHYFSKRKIKRRNVENLEGEEWFDVVDFEGSYKISNFLRLKSLKRNIPVGSKGFTREYGEKLIVPFIAENGYMYVNMNKGGIFYLKLHHRIVSQVFIPNPDNKPYVNHLNGVRSDFRIENLEWCTAKENSDHSVLVLNNVIKGATHPKSKPITIFYSDGSEETLFSMTEAARKLNTYPQSISLAIKKGRPHNGNRFKIENKKVA